MFRQVVTRMLRVVSRALGSCVLHVGALVIRVGFWAPQYYSYGKEPYGILSGSNHLGFYITG